jgi:hypothetical protein
MRAFAFGSAIAPRFFACGAVSILNDWMREWLNKRPRLLRDFYFLRETPVCPNPDS